MSDGPAPEAGGGSDPAPGRRGSAGLLLGFGIAAIALAVLVTFSSAPDPVGRGSKAPAFALQRLGGGAPVALEDLRGKVVLLNFWATWCKPCEDEMPAMERLYQALDRDDFDLLAVSVDEDPDEVARFVSRLGVTFPVLLDPDKDVAGAYQTFRFPETLLIGRDGVVVERYVGPKEWDAVPYVERMRRMLGSPGAAG